MRLALARAVGVSALGLLALARVAAGGDPPQDPHASVEVTSDRATRFVGEAFTLRLRIAYDVAWFRANAVPLFLRATDVPVAVSAPGWDALPGAARLRDIPRDPSDARPRETLALGDEVVDAVRVGDALRDGRTFAVLEVARRFSVSAAGPLVVAAPSLRYAHATSFRDDLLGNRVPLNRREVAVEGGPLALRIDPLPEEGRPANFRGAVGRFRLEASADRSEVRVGEAFRLTLRLSGDGDLENVELPRPALHVFGVVDDRASPTRTAVFEVAVPREGVTSVPPIDLPHFDPGPPAGYRVARTDAIPLVVRASTSEPPAPPHVPRHAEDDSPRGSALLAAITALVACLALGAVLLARRRRRARRARSEGGDTRLATALLAVRAAVSRPEADLSDPFAELLAARLSCAPAAVISSDVGARLSTAGVPPDLATRAASLLHALVAARYGGASPAESSGEVAALSEQIANSERGSLRRERS